MANVNSLMAFGKPPAVARAVVASDGADHLVRLGVHAELAKRIVSDESNPARFMALGMPAALAAEVVKITAA